MRKTIYIFGELYETGLTNDVLADRLKDAIGVWKHEDGKEPECTGTERIIFDSSEPKSIAELRRYGVDVYGAKKGKDSVVHGVQWLQQQTIIIDVSCVNMQNEIQTYKWKEDAGGIVVKSGGLPVPVDKNNHLIDATRYAYEDDMNEATAEIVENIFYN
jgi:phage terminase large subunit